MKKQILTILLLCLLLIVTLLLLVACNDKDTPVPTPDEVGNIPTPDPDTSPDTSDDDSQVPSENQPGENKPNEEPSHTHVFGEWTTVKAVTCFENGVRERTCSCGKKETEAIRAVGHVEVVDPAVTATATVAGKTEGRHCSVCGEILVPQKIVYVKGFGGLEYKLYAGVKSYSVTGIGTCTDSDVIIPDIYDNLPVTDIESAAFAGCTGITSIKIPGSVQVIGVAAFSGCTGLATITISNSVECIRERAFSECISLTGVYITDLARWCRTFFESGDANPLSFAHNLYLNGNLIKNLVIPDDIMSIEDYVFCGGTSFTSITIPNSVTSIGGSAFSGCTNLTSITIPSNVTSIGERAFEGCYKLVEVYNLSPLTIKKGDTSNGYVGYYALTVHTLLSEASNVFTDENGFIFYEDNKTCYLLGYTGKKTSLILPKTYNGKEYVIHLYAFDGHTDLTSIILPDNIISIGEGVFCDCASLTSITIPNSVTSIGNYAFYGCTSLTSIIIPDGVTSIGEAAFYGCTGLASITIPNSITSIDNYAFYNCIRLTSIVIPKSVTRIGAAAFDGCIKLVEVYNLSNLTIEKSSYDNGKVGYYTWVIHTSLSETNKVFTDENGFVFYEDGETCYLLSYLGKETALTLPKNCHGKKYVIYRCAFYDCANLTSVIIPTGVTSIEDSAFLGCTSLASITFQGTKAQWNQISKNNSWNSNTSNYIIHCTDGDIAKQ